MINISTFSSSSSPLHLPMKCRLLRFTPSHLPLMFIHPLVDFMGCPTVGALPSLCDFAPSWATTLWTKHATSCSQFLYTVLYCIRVCTCYDHLDPTSSSFPIFWKLLRWCTSRVLKHGWVCIIRQGQLGFGIQIWCYYILGVNKQKRLLKVMFTDFLEQEQFQCGQADFDWAPFTSWWRKEWTVWIWFLSPGTAWSTASWNSLFGEGVSGSSCERPRGFSTCDVTLKVQGRRFLQTAITSGFSLEVLNCDISLYIIFLEVSFNSESPAILSRSDRNFKNTGLALSNF